MLKSRGEKEYFTFRIPYWDWRKDQQTDENSPFQLNRLGETVNNNGLPEVHGNTYSEFLNNWETVCWKKTKFNTSNICNPQVSTGQLQRCPLMEESCGSKNKLWPNDNEVQTALSMEIYDTSPYNRTAANSFRNQLEGFKPLSNDDLRSCRENKLCTCDFKNFNCTESNDGIQPANPTQRILHNSVSIQWFKFWLIVHPTLYQCSSTMICTYLASSPGPSLCGRRARYIPTAHVQDYQ